MLANIAVKCDILFMGTIFWLAPQRWFLVVIIRQGESNNSTLKRTVGYDPHYLLY